MAEIENEIRDLSEFFQTHSFVDAWVYWQVLSGKSTNDINEYFKSYQVNIIGTTSSNDDKPINESINIEKLRESRDKMLRLKDLALKLEGKYGAHTLLPEPKQSDTGLKEVNKKLEKLQNELENVKKINNKFKKIIFSSVASYGAESSIQMIPINMYLDTTDGNKIYTAYQAVLDFLSEIEFETTLDFEAIKGSWIKQWISNSKKAMTSEEVIDRLKEAEYGVEVNAILKPQSEVEKNQSEALLNILNSLNGINHAAIRIGSLLVVKVTNASGEVNVQVRTLSILELHLINKHPELLNQPKQILVALNALIEEDATNSINSNETNRQNNQNRLK